MNFRNLHLLLTNLLCIYLFICLSQQQQQIIDHFSTMNLNEFSIDCFQTQTSLQMHYLNNDP